MVYNKTVIDWFLGQQQFCWPSNRPVALNLRLRATYSSFGQTNLMLSSNPVNNCKLFSVILNRGRIAVAGVTLEKRKSA